jgi:hypothetical protein
MMVSISHKMFILHLFSQVIYHHSLILGFIQVEMKYYAVVQLSNDAMSMEQMTEDFVCKFALQPNTPTSVVEIESISNSLLVFKNYGGSTSEYFCTLPQRKWGRYFGERIIVP